MTNTQKPSEEWEETFTVEQAIAWSEKHRQLTSDAVRVVHIRQLLEQVIQATREESEEKIKVLESALKDALDELNHNMGH